jgi:hypothetical protein
VSHISSRIALLCMYLQMKFLLTAQHKSSVITKVTSNNTRLYDATAPYKIYLSQLPLPPTTGGLRVDPLLWLPPLARNTCY